LDDRADGRHVERLLAARRLVQPAVLQTLGDSLSDVVTNVVEVWVTAFETWPREIPVKVGMMERDRQPARLASSARRPISILT